MKKKLCIKVKEEGNGRTVQSYLRICAGFSKAQIRSMKFRENGICRNGKRCRVTEVLKTGDVLELLLENGERTSEHLVSGSLPLSVLYEDEDVLAVDKPVGIAVHPSHGHYNDTLANQLAAYLREKEEEVQIHSVGRLDKETSGIVLFAKNRVAAARLSGQREKGELKKQYLALCEWRRGTEKEDDCHVITGPVAPLPGSLMKMCVHPEGKEAVTHFIVEQQYEETALVRLWLETGRTHQIRVHMASEGHPLLGDRLYGGESCAPSGVERTALHAETLEFFQPFTGERISVRAKLPKDMQEYIEKQRICCLQG